MVAIVYQKVKPCEQIKRSCKRLKNSAHTFGKDLRNEIQNQKVLLNYLCCSREQHKYKKNMESFDLH